jgi:hypothetical protein
MIVSGSGPRFGMAAAARGADRHEGRCLLVLSWGDSDLNVLGLSGCPLHEQTLIDFHYMFSAK